MLKRLFAAIDRLINAVNGTAERFEQTNQDWDARRELEAGVNELPEPKRKAK